MVVLVGFGHQMSSEYLPSLEKIGQKIEAVCDPDPASKVAATKNGVPAYGEIADLPVGMDAFSALVAVPHYKTPTVIQDLLSKGFKRILIEKPPALSTQALNIVQNDIFASKAKVFVASKRRYLKTYEEGKSLLKKSTRAKFLSLKIHRCFERNESSWRSYPEKAGKSVLFDLGYHAVDLLHWITDFDKNYSIKQFAFQNLDFQQPNWSRAKFEVYFPEQSLTVRIDVDRVAPSPFEQLIIDDCYTQCIINPRTLLSYKKESETADVLNLEPAGDDNATNEMLIDFFQNESPIISEYSQHALHLGTIEKSLYDENQERF